MHLLRLLVMRQDFDRPSIDIALDLIFAATKYRAEKKFIELGLPEHCDPRPDIDYDPNTFVPIKMDSRFDARLEGRNGFLYRRLSLLEINDIETLSIDPPFIPYRTRDVLDQINEKLQTQFTLTDLVDKEYTIGQMILEANKNSLVWTGTSRFESVDPNKPPLFAEGALSGFVKAPDYIAPN